MILYPKAVSKPLLDHSVPGTLTQRKLLVMHITEGGTADGAIQTFKSSVAPHRVSAHFVIDRDGTVYQLLPLSDTAWHASQVNSVSVGIEHVAISGGKLPVTEAQYEASAALVGWLCGQLDIPCTRAFVKSHFEASPKDGHVLCCQPTLDLDRVVNEVPPMLPGAPPA